MYVCMPSDGGDKVEQIREIVVYLSGNHKFFYKCQIDQWIGTHA